MATFEVFVPVQGEIIYTIDADNAIDAENIVSTMDWSDGDLNVDYGDGDTRVELVDGAEGDLDDDDDDDDDEMSSAAIRDARDDPWSSTALTVNLETFHNYVMRHYQP